MADRVALQRVAEVIAAADKRAFHCKRGYLTLEDVRLAAGAPVHGSATSLPQLLHADGGLLFRAEPELATAEAAETPLPAAPLEVGVTPHWLAVGGVQPATAENTQPRRTATPATGGAAAAREALHGQAMGVAAMQGSGQQLQRGCEAGSGGAAGGGILAGLPLRHTMPDELQLYFDMVRRTLQGGAPLAGRAVAASLATDPGLQPALPHLVPLLAEEVGKGLRDADHLRLVISAVRGLLSNSHLQLAPYIHHLLPAILTCLVARSISTGEEHWAIRDEAASLLGQVALLSRQHRDELAEALARVQKMLAASLFDAAPQTQYGSLVGLSAFGAPVLMATVVPNLARYAQLLQSDKGAASNISTAAATLHVHSALMLALRRCTLWNGGVNSTTVRQAVADAGLGDASQVLAAVSPAHLYV